MSEPRVSFEFFPPRTPKGNERLVKRAATLDRVGPDFFSVTYGAGGSTRDRTLETVLALRAEGLVVAPHLSFGSASDEAVLELLETYRDAGIRRIVALRGDVPSGLGTARQLRYAEELVAFIRAHTGDHFHVEVAAYPECHPDSTSPDDDLRYFRRKVEAGADSAITQFFYNTDAYFDYVERCRLAGLNIPIFPGVMPITNYVGLARFADSCGAEIPRWIRRRLETYRDDEDSLREFGESVVTRLCEKLIAGGAPGLHFYTLNQTQPSLRIWERLIAAR
ncbi:MAG: methylenetetrahydrofolate reductase [NAD(P)H] [Gammaproteobacteria bacterium]|jgi:methylenetetrahydrofolate reductase (NADPH)